MYLVFDIGGTNTRIAVSKDGKNIDTVQTIPTKQSFEEEILSIKQIYEQFGKQTIQSAAAGVAGVLDAEKSHLLKSPNLPLWVNKPLKDALEEILNTSVKLENDVALGGLGEANLEEFRNQKIIAYIAIGTGVGGVRIVNGNIDENSQGFEPGHQIIVEGGKSCHCGGLGHLESYVGGAYLQEPIPWDEVTKYLAIGLLNVIVCWSPDIVILGGGVAENIPLDRLSENIRQLLTIFPKVPKVAKSSLGTQATIRGALKLLK